MRVIIAGGRDFDDYALLKESCDNLIPDDAIILSGGARGADRLGEQYAKERGLSIERHPADWDQYGRSAGMIRNREMAKAADSLVAFWDGKSKGTAHMIQTAEKMGLMVKVVRYE